MAGDRVHPYLALRLTAAILLLSCVSPLPEARGAKSVPLDVLLRSFDGQVRLVISKSLYTLTLVKGDIPLKTYRAVFGKGYRDGDKRVEGDKRTPEGEFYICTMNTSKRFYKFMGLSYPGMKHADEGLRSALITPAEHAEIRKAIDERQAPPWETRLGGAVGIHGRMADNGAAPLAWADVNWTDGCIALYNADVDELYGLVSLGTPVTITP